MPCNKFRVIGSPKCDSIFQSAKTKAEYDKSNKEYDYDGKKRVDKTHEMWFPEEELIICGDVLATELSSQGQEANLYNLWNILTNTRIRVMFGPNDLNLLKCIHLLELKNEQNHPLISDFNNGDIGLTPKIFSILIGKPEGLFSSLNPFSSKPEQIKLEWKYPIINNIPSRKSDTAHFFTDRLHYIFGKKQTEQFIHYFNYIFTQSADSKDISNPDLKTGFHHFVIGAILKSMLYKKEKWDIYPSKIHKIKEDYYYPKPKYDKVLTYYDEYTKHDEISEEHLGGFVTEEDYALAQGTDHVHIKGKTSRFFRGWLYMFFTKRKNRFCDVLVDISGKRMYLLSAAGINAELALNTNLIDIDYLYSLSDANQLSKRLFIHGGATAVEKRIDNCLLQKAVLEVNQKLSSIKDEILEFDPDDDFQLTEQILYFNNLSLIDQLYHVGNEHMKILHPNLKQLEEMIDDAHYCKDSMDPMTYLRDIKYRIQTIMSTEPDEVYSKELEKLSIRLSGIDTDFVKSPNKHRKILNCVLDKLYLEIEQINMKVAKHKLDKTDFETIEREVKVVNYVLDKSNMENLERLRDLSPVVNSDSLYRDQIYLKNADWNLYQVIYDTKPKHYYPSITHNENSTVINMNSNDLYGYPNHTGIHLFIELKEDPYLNMWTTQSSKVGMHQYKGETIRTIPLGEMRVVWNDYPTSSANRSFILEDCHFQINDNLFTELKKVDEDFIIHGLCSGKILFTYKGILFNLSLDNFHKFIGEKVDKKTDFNIFDSPEVEEEVVVEEPKVEKKGIFNIVEGWFGGGMEEIKKNPESQRKFILYLNGHDKALDKLIRRKSKNTKKIEEHKKILRDGIQILESINPNLKKSNIN